MYLTYFPETDELHFSCQQGNIHNTTIQATGYFIASFFVSSLFLRCKNLSAVGHMATLACTSISSLKSPSSIGTYTAMTDRLVCTSLSRPWRQNLPATQKYGSKISLAGRYSGTYYKIQGTFSRSLKVFSSLESDSDMRPNKSGEITSVIDTEGDDIVVLAPLAPLSPATATLSKKVTGIIKGFIGHVQKPAVIALILLALITGNPDFAVAASSGGRIGGRSFSSGGGGSSRGYSGGSSQSYSVPSRSYTPSYSAPYYSAPWGSPFGGFYSSPTVVVGGGGGGGGGIFNFFLLSIVAMFLGNLVLGFISDRNGDGGMLGSSTKTSVVRLQVGLLGLARSLQKDLDRIAEKADTSSPEGLHFILTETVLALLRHPDYCVYGRSTTEVKRSVEEGEAAFNAVSLEERGKFREETLVNVGDVKRKGRFTPRGDRFQNEYLVVTVVVATEGEVKLPNVNNTADLRAALAKLGSVPADQIQAVEILWTPQDEEDTLSERELLTDYPSLRSL